jgi:hypothetical protein
MRFREIIATSSKRERFIYVIAVLWVGLGAIGIWTKANLLDLAEYFQVFYPYALAYLGAETFRPSGTGELKMPKLPKFKK